MKKVLSLFLSVLMMFSIITTVDMTSVNAVDTNQIISTINNAYTEGLHSENYKERCGDYVIDTLHYYGINFVTNGKGLNGNQWYYNITGDKTSDGKYYQKKYSGSDCLYNLINDYGNELYYVVVSFPHQYGYTNANPGEGHVVLLYAIVDNTVYFSESYDSSDGIKHGKAHAVPVSTFLSRYTSSYGAPIGAIYFEPVHTHSYSSSVTKAATCKEPGVMTYTCSCGSSYTEQIEKKAHKDSNKDGKCDVCRNIAYTTGDIIEIGSYPQSIVKDSALIEKLNTITLDTKNDVTYKKVKYRKYKDNWYKYESLQWRVMTIDNDRIVLISEKVIDSKPMNPSGYGNQWKDSYLSNWLTDTFVVDAFGDLANSMNIAVSIPSQATLKNEDYGFPSDNNKSRIAYATDYASSEYAYYYWTKDTWTFGLAYAYVVWCDVGSFTQYFFQDQTNGVRPIISVDASKLCIDDSNNNISNCTCNCHKSGILNIIFKVIIVFQRIFGQNKTCKCGVKHY